MHICEYLKQATAPLFSAEIIPPKKGDAWPKVLQAVERMQQAGISWISITSHVHEREWQEISGLRILRIKRKRLDTNALCIALKVKLGIEVMAHTICCGFTKDETEDALFNLHVLGIDNVLALRGDPISGNVEPVACLRNEYAADLVEQIVKMNQGAYLDAIANAVRTDFCIGVAGYPEKHYQAKDFASDLAYLKAKVDQGAHFIITQLFFDNDYYYRFVEAARRLGITVPIIPGIKPVYKKTHITTLPEIFHVSVPPALWAIVERYSRPEDIRAAGLEYTIKQCQELLAYGVPALHFYTMSLSDPTILIMHELLRCS